MTEHSRYNVNNETNDGVLKNKLGIKDNKTLEDTETLLLSDTYEQFFKMLKNHHIEFNGQLIFKIHKYFLETIYGWAGKIRTVEISKGGILFCASSQIKNALKKLDEVIEDNLPKNTDKIQKVAEKLAIMHCEFNAIHPFREGNGRTIRLFLDLLTANSGFNPMDYSKSSQEEYIQACIAGMKQNYSKMKSVTLKGLSTHVVPGHEDL